MYVHIVIRCMVLFDTFKLFHEEKKLWNNFTHIHVHPFDYSNKTNQIQLYIDINTIKY